MLFQPKKGSPLPIIQNLNKNKCKEGVTFANVVSGTNFPPLPTPNATATKPSEIKNSSKEKSTESLRKINLISLNLHAEIVEVEIEVVLPSIVPSGNFAEPNRTVTCMVLKAYLLPCHDEFHGPRSDYVRQVALENIKNMDCIHS
ncbi:hypothetical protein TNCV_4452921 [Trichonephila clavipes]|nr:hypothetical protein TNCV_4452921 [Trichonephila clavipes]